MISDIIKMAIAILIIGWGIIYGFGRLIHGANFSMFGGKYNHKVVEAPKDFRSDIVIRDSDGNEYDGGKMFGHPARTAAGTVFLRPDGKIVVLNQNGIEIYEKK